MSFLAVDDVDKRVAKAVKAGAKLVMPVFDVPGVGRIAMLRGARRRRHRLDDARRRHSREGMRKKKPHEKEHGMITISAFKWVPDFAQGQVRDLRARWALEEAGLPYRTRLLGQGDQDKPDYRALQPFGQVPILEDDGFALFESGAIVLYVGERSETLLPKDPQARARATQWLIAALNSIEPFVMDVARIDIFYADQEWAKLRRPGAVEFARGASRPSPRRSATSPTSTATASRRAI